MAALPSLLIDVLTPESFAEEHLPGAANYCVYETAFSDNIRQAFPDLGISLTVYGFNDATLEAETAREKLAALGYKNVALLPGGLEGWKAAGGEIESSSLAGGAPFSGRLEIDRAVSFIHWTGRNLFNHHTGEIKLGAGVLEVSEGRVVGGTIRIDLNSLGCSDLTDAALNSHLIAHLRSDDFFSVEKYPEAVYEITSATFLDATLGRPNYRFCGELRLRGEVHPYEFQAVVANTSAGVYTAQACLEFDRTLWGAKYGSGKFFARLGQHVVNDLVQIQFKVVTRPAA